MKSANMCIAPPNGSRPMLPPHAFFFLRHGQTDWNAQGRIQGHTDMPLNETGIAQARSAAGRLVGHGIDCIASSPLARAHKTAGFVAERLRLPVHLDDGLKERTFGAFEGRIIDDVKREHGIAPEQPISMILPPDAEQWPQTLARSRTVVAKWLTTHPGKTVLFVSHDGLFRALHEQLLGTRPGATHAAPYRFAPAEEGWTVTELA
jgi:2,3-bisphosphoglycerate-dependent phosphoglycerate mutase